MRMTMRTISFRMNLNAAFKQAQRLPILADALLSAERGAGCAAPAVAGRELPADRVIHSARPGGDMLIGAGPAGAARPMPAAF